MTRGRLARVFGPCLALLLALSCAACKEGPPATEVLVVIDGAESTRGALVRLEVQVVKGRELNGPKQMMQINVGPQTGHAWPVSFSIAANDQDARDEFRVVITGFDEDQTAIVEQQAITSFQPNRAGRLDLFLYAGCAGLCRAEGAPGAETCGAGGRCTPVPVLNELPEAEPDKLGGYAPVMMEPGSNPDRDGSPSTPASPEEAGSSAPADANTRSDGAIGADAGTPTEAGTSAPMEAGSDPGQGAGLDGGLTDGGREAGPSEAGMEAGAPRDAQAETGPAYAADPVIPTPSGACPSFVSGASTIMGVSVQIYAGPASSGTKAPLLFYWHGIGSTGAAAGSMIPNSVRTEILDAGGIIVAPNGSVATGGDISGAALWYEGDLELSDLVTGCAVRDHNVDPRRIYVMGCSAGGLAAGTMGLRRARYVAASAPNSGGLLDAGVNYTEPGATRVARVMTMHGPSTSDVVIQNFATLSLDLCRATRATGAIAIDCEHGAGHCGAPVALQEAAWRFMKDHPYGLATEPYASGLPAAFPSSCRITSN